MNAKILRKGPVLLAPDNFTPLERTPWAGESIGRLYKDRIVPECFGRRIGESWEFSCDPDFPSYLKDRQETLQQLIVKHPREILSPRLAEASSTCEILVKLLNASSPLSLQVHPRDDDEALAPGECGKPESWLVLRADEGAGIYMGFSRAMSRAELKEVLAAGDAARGVLHFVPVKKGDYFEIGPGVAHAVGPGVDLLEPQRILFGKSGKTYRLWDWGRRYDHRGELDHEHGQPRRLHLEEGLRLVDSTLQVGDEFVTALRRMPAYSTPVPGVDLATYPPNDYYQTLLITGDAGRRFKLDLQDGYGAGLVLKGCLQAAGTCLLKGQSALLPHVAMPMEFDCLSPSELALVIPTGTTTRFS